MDDGVAAVAEIEGESPYLIEEASELNDSSMLGSDSNRKIKAGSSSATFRLLYSVVLFFSRGGKCFLLFEEAAMSSRVGELQAEAGCEDERFECRFECNGSVVGGSPLMVPGHGIATETSLHWKCS